MKIASRSRGFALVLVLITIVLVAAMAVLFLTSAGNERRGVDLYARGSQARNLAAMTVNRVMGQINAATKEGTATAPVSWASQPGMIRTYGANGAPKSVYKLYSWDNLFQAGSAFTPSAATEIPPAGWKASTALFTDLNQPMGDVYPIVDPRAAGVVEGFSIDATNGVVAGSDSAAPMPVKWLYVLEDGQMVAPSASSGDTATIPGASSGNPIVGRVAFWTDDETSKVNVNTASEGAFWDTPKSGSRDDMQFAGNPPVKGEFQRTPGHPFMTSLSAVFPELLTVDRWEDTTTYRTDISSIYALTPRVQSGGSQGGTYPIGNYTFDYQPAFNSISLPSPITIDTERLFATADEFWFRPDRSDGAALKAKLSAGADDFRKRLFFLTANSKAPETTLFETPRISLWPITWPWTSSYFTKRGGTAPSLNPNTASLDANPWMAPEEKLLAFCSTLNAAAPTEAERQRYYFQRQNPDSPTHDWSEILRNQQLVGYLSRELNEDIPGWGASLASKWGSTTADWIALNCLDYSRSFINQYTMSSLTAGLVYSYTGVAFRRVTFGTTSRSDYKEPNAYTVSPLRVSLNGHTHVSQGAYPALDEVAVMFYATQRLEPVLTGTARTNPFHWRNMINPGGTTTLAPYGTNEYDNGTPSDPTDDVGSRTTEMRAIMFFDFSKMLPGVMNYSPVFWIKVRGGSFSVNGAPIGLPATGGSVIRWDTRTAAPVPKNFASLYAFDPANPSDVEHAKTFSNSATGVNAWTLISDPIPVSPNALGFNFDGTSITVEIYAPYSNNLEADPTGDSTRLISQKVVNFGAWSGNLLPIPLAPRWTTFDGQDAQKPDPAFPSTGRADGETRNTKWAYSETAPLVTQLIDDPMLDPRDRAGVNNKPVSVPASYVYSGPITGGVRELISPTIATRVLSLAQKIPYGKKFNGEGGTDLFQGSAPSFFEEAWALITPYDTVISMVSDPASGAKGDSRLATDAPFVRVDSIAGLGQPAEVFRSSPAANTSTRYFPRSTARAQKHQLGTPGKFPLATGYRVLPTLGSSVLARYGGRLGEGTASGNMGNNDKTNGMVGAEFNALGGLPVGDWTTMPGNAADGGYLARPDQEFQALFADPSDTNWMQVPYFQSYDGYEAAAASYFSPNREVPSPVILGSLPSSQTTGWQTLAFSPNPANSSHPGLLSPPDHLLLDLFWMPIAEPYPISDQFSTAGKINLNYAIMPFSYIKRKTALHALMKAIWMTVLPDTAATNYKSHFFFRQDGTRTRFPIDVSETLKAFDQKFAAGDLFRSGSQICEMFLVPEGQSLSSVQVSFWNNKRLTADNAREQPYDHLYSRITTKSNTFTVHWRAQVLRKNPNGDADKWDGAKDRVASDLRGSSLIERYINPNATDIPDYATDADATPLTHFYKWRVVSENLFQP